ncbi:MAG: protein translocase subunit SecD [Verrucomicrobia bacterium]|nr:protein translocase subunit SecD [Verrucomicrobiota bacterium]
MKRNNVWRWAFLAFVVAWSLREVYPPMGRNLIEHFQDRAANREDARFTNIVAQAQALQAANPVRTYGNLVDAIGTNDITALFPDLKPEPGSNPTRWILSKLQQEAAGRIKLGLDLRGGTSFLVEMQMASGTDTNSVDAKFRMESMLSQAAEVLRKRVDRLGVAEPLIQPVGSTRIQIALPGLTDAENESARQTIEKAAFLEFRMVHPESAEYLAQGIPAPGYEVLTIAPRRPEEGQTPQPFLVKKKPERGLTGKNVRYANVVRDPVTNEPEIHFTLDDEGRTKFGEITMEYRPQGNKFFLLGIVLDGELISAPRINEPILGGRGTISGGFDLDEAITLANALENPLEAPVKIVEERRVDPSLGADSIRSGVVASIVGTVLVSLFMLVYYLFAGVVANIALLLNIVLLMGVMGYIETTLTIPGIAGIVLTVGMAVDANVLIYERIREELAAGKSMRGALAAGYDKAFGTIFDSNLTTLISSVILIYMGTGPVRGFGVTLTIGVMVSMFTALVVTRLLFDLCLERGWITSLPMLRFVKETRIDFLKFAKPAFVISWLVIVIGIAYGVYRGKDTLGVDFAGGDTLTLGFAERVEVDQLREAAARAGAGESLIQYQKELSTGTETLRVTVPYDMGVQVDQALREAFPAAKFERLALDRVGATVGKEIQLTALKATILSLFGILIYVAVRYEFSFAVGAVVAIIHDILITIGWFCLSGRQFSAPMVAAILTIIGFSINDTIVIFDRIREDLRLGVRGTFREVINQALNQCLSRTIITSGTVLLATLSLYIFGGGVINDFAFAFLVGVLTGCYSTIYIANALVLWWHKGERPKLSAQIVEESPAAANA